MKTFKLKTKNALALALAGMLVIGTAMAEKPSWAGECAGAKSASTIACLQPDRHVFVEISGSRIKQ